MAFPTAKGPRRPLYRHQLRQFGVWRFSPNKAAAKDFLRYVTTKAAFQEMVEASKGYDIPPYECVRPIQMSPSLPDRDVTVVGVGRWAGAEPVRSAVPARRPPHGPRASVSPLGL